jgi:hypothetical protein
VAASGEVTFDVPATMRMAGLVLLVALAGNMSIAAAQTVDRTDARTAVAIQSLERYRSTRSLADLGDAIRILTSALDTTYMKSSEYVSERRAIVRAWSMVLVAIERAYDPTFNPEDPRNIPETCVSPPVEADGSVQRPCTDPSAITDPKARAAYIAAIKANDLKIQRMRTYRDVHNLDEAAMLSLRMNLASFKAVRAQSDDAALEQILRQSGISEARRRKIEAML